MKYLWFIVILIICGCKSNDSSNEIEIETQVEAIKPDNAVPAPPQNSEIKPGEYFEYHPSGGIKIRGFYNNNLNREGLWLSYYENGTKWSEAYYTDGKREGHNITFYPSGKIRFVGEYADDQKTGTWTFYDEAGEVTKIENF